MEERIVSPTERGQITIPKELRERLNIDYKTKMKVYLEDGRIILEPVSSLDMPLRRPPLRRQYKCKIALSVA